MKLDPDDYTCPDHQTDLTSQVLDALDDDGPPVAYRRPGFLGGRKPGPRPFEVRVTCPGGGQPHQLTCAGTWTR
jgi:hypothetical protein